MNEYRAPRAWHIAERFGRFYVENQHGGFSGWHTDREAAVRQGQQYVADHPGDTFTLPDTRACVCAHHTDGSVTTFLCPVHADTDPCLTMSQCTGRRRTGTIRRGVCTSCGHTSGVTR